MRRGGNYNLLRNGRKTGKKYVIKQWEGVSLIENPNQKLARNSSMGIYSGSKINLGGALVFGSFPRQPHEVEVK
jgi:Fe2+ transport system protein FeoA